MTSKDERVLIYSEKSDSGHDHRFLIFATTQNLDFLANIPLWIADATFKSCAALFKQLYIIRVVNEGNLHDFLDTHERFLLFGHRDRQRESQVALAFDELMNSEYFVIELQESVMFKDYIKYFKATWMQSSKCKKKKKKKKRQERYVLRTCNEVILNGEIKTSNSAEGFRNGFADLMGMKPTIWNFIL
ncbi:hypothetical protein DMENIID0001_005610 [Sergentomyia squamirostris]